MTTSQTSFLAEIVDDKKVIPEGKLAYFRERQRNRLYDFIVSRFLEKEKAGRLSRADLARRLNKKPEQITRWLSTPGNWTLDTISDLILGICGGELKFALGLVTSIQRNYTQHARLDHYEFTCRPVASTKGNEFSLTGQHVI